MRILLTTAVLGTIMASDIGAARSSMDAPWCTSVQIAHSEELNCHYRTFEECYPNIIGGNRGFCVQNPHWGEREPKLEKPKRHRNHRVNRD